LLKFRVGGSVKLKIKKKGWPNEQGSLFYLRLKMLEDIPI